MGLFFSSEWGRLLDGTGIMGLPFDNVGQILNGLDSHVFKVNSRDYLV